MRYKGYVAAYAGESQEVNKENYFLNGICKEDFQDLCRTEINKDFKSRNIYALASGVKNDVKGAELAYIAVDVLKGFYGADFTKENRTYFEFANAAVNSHIFEINNAHFEVDVSILYIGNNKATVYNIGDATVYYFVNGAIKKLTGKVPETVQIEKTIVDAKGEKKTQIEKKDTIPYIGFQSEICEVAPYVSETIKLKRNGYFVICGKEVSECLTEEEISAILQDKSIKGEDKAVAIIDVAKDKNPDGNYTAEVIEVRKGVSFATDEMRSLGTWLAVALACAAVSFSFPYIADAIGSVIDSCKDFIESYIGEDEIENTLKWIPRVSEEKDPDTKPETEKTSEDDVKNDNTDERPSMPGVQVTKPRVPAVQSGENTQTKPEENVEIVTEPETVPEENSLSPEVNSDVELPIDFN